EEFDNSEPLENQSESNPQETPAPLEDSAEQSILQNRLDLSHIRQGVDAIKAEVQKIIVGQDEVIDLLLAAILSGGHVLLEGVPGIAKTLLAKLLSKTMQIGFSRIQFTPDLMPSDVLGTTVFNMRTSEFSFNHGPIFSNI